MKKILLLLAFAPLVSRATTANDLSLSQVNPGNTGFIQRLVGASGPITSTATFRSTLAIAGITDNNTFTGTNTFPGFTLTGPVSTTYSTMSSTVIDVTKSGLNRTLTTSEQESFSATPTTAISIPVVYVSTGGPWTLTYDRPVYSYSSQSDVSGTGIILPGAGTWKVIYSYSPARTQWELAAAPVLTTGTGAFVLAGSPILNGLVQIDNNATTPPTPRATTMLQLTAADGSGSDDQSIEIDTFGSIASFHGRRTSGTNASKTALGGATTILALRAYGYDGTSYSGTADAEIALRTSGNYSGSSHPAEIRFLGTLAGSTTQTLTGVLNPVSLNLPQTTNSTSSTTGSLTIGNGTASTNIGFGAGNGFLGGTLQVTGHVTLEGTTSTGATGSGNLVFSASPALTGTPTAPTASPGTNTTQLATTAFVIANAGGAAPGSDTQIIYNNSGALGANAGLTINKSTGAVTQTQNSLSGSTAAGVIITNTTAAVTGGTQVSPALLFHASNFDENAGLSKTIDFRIYNDPPTGQFANVSSLVIERSLNGGGYFNIFSLSSAGALSVDSVIASNITASGTVTIGTSGNGNLISSSNAPAAVPGTGAGTVGTPTSSVSGTSMAGVLTVNTATTPGVSATVVTVTYSSAFPNSSYVVLTPANAATAILSGVTMVYAVGSASNFVITSGTTGLTGSTTYAWNYLVIGK